MPAPASASALAPPSAIPRSPTWRPSSSPSADKPIDLSAGPAAPLIMKMRDRMSFMRTREIRDAKLRTASAEEQLRHNAWELTGLADPTKPVVVPDLLATRGWTDLDYMKIDTDGIDWQILQSFEGACLKPAGGADGSELRGRRCRRRALLPQHRPLPAPSRLRPVPARRPQLLLARPARPLHLADAGRDPFGPPFQGEAYYALDLLGLQTVPARLCRPQCREGREAGRDPVQPGRYPMPRPSFCSAARDASWSPVDQRRPRPRPARGASPGEIGLGRSTIAPTWRGSSNT